MDSGLCRSTSKTLLPSEEAALSIYCRKKPKSLYPVNQLAQTQRCYPSAVQTLFHKQTQATADDDDSDDDDDDRGNSMEEMTCWALWCR